MRLLYFQLQRILSMEGSSYREMCISWTHWLCQLLFKGVCHQQSNSGWSGGKMRMGAGVPQCLLATVENGVWPEQLSAFSLPLLQIKPGWEGGACKRIAVNGFERSLQWELYTMALWFQQPLWNNYLPSPPASDWVLMDIVSDSWSAEQDKLSLCRVSVCFLQNCLLSLLISHGKSLWNFWTFRRSSLW